MQHLLSSGDFLVRVLLGAGYLISRVVHSFPSSSSERERDRDGDGERERQRERDTQRERERERE